MWGEKGREGRGGNNGMGGDGSVLPEMRRDFDIYRVMRVSSYFVSLREIVTSLYGIICFHLFSQIAEATGQYLYLKDDR
jgi:hypothetical protein